MPFFLINLIKSIMGTESKQSKLTKNQKIIIAVVAIMVMLVIGYFVGYYVGQTIGGMAK
jgi:uncharacterized membrane protein